MIPSDPDALLTRPGLAEALTESGFPIAARTLATKASRGGGPPYRHFGPKVIYRWGDGLLWARSQLGPLQCTSCEKDATPAVPGADSGTKPMNGGATEAAPAATSSAAKAGGTALEKKLRRPLAALGLSPRAHNALVTDGLISVGDLVRRFEADVLGIPNVGRGSFDEIKRVLARHRLRLGMELPAPDAGVTAAADD